MEKHRTPHNISLFILIFGLTACSSRIISTPVSQTLVSITPSQTYPKSTSLTSTDIPFKQMETQFPTTEITTTSTPVPLSTATLITGYTYIENCIDVEDTHPKEIYPKDELLLYNMKGRQNLAYDFETQETKRSPIPYNSFTWEDDFKLSPNQKWMAYIEYTYKGEKLSSRKLAVQNVDGRKVDMSYWIADWQWILGWMDDQHLVLGLPQYRNGSIVVLNPFSREWRVNSLTLPNLAEPAPGELPKQAIYNSGANYVVYLEAIQRFRGDKYYSWILYDLEKDEPIWKYWVRFQEDYWQNIIFTDFPKWSPDGNRFVIVKNVEYFNSSWPKKDIVIVGLDGKEDPVLLKQDQNAQSSFAWSPDGKLLAILLSTDFDNNKVLLANIEQKTLTDLCIDIHRNWNMKKIPIWSPDGNFLALALKRGNEFGYWEKDDTILVDINHQRAFRLQEYAIPVGWMQKP